MNKAVPILSRGMVILGGLMILAGLGWGLWTRIHRAPEPTITEAGAVVLAVTAPSLAVTSTPIPTALPVAPTQPPRAAGPTPALLPDWTITPEQPEPTPTPSPAAPLPPESSPPPTPTSPPPAEKPPSHIAAPSIQLDAQVVPMGWEMVDHDGTLRSAWVVPENAAGWHMNSALPGHGENVVLSGHHNIAGKVFRYVVDLKPGDPITLYVDDTPYLYTVTEKYILKETGMSLRVRQKNAQWILPSGDERLTLVTCWPYEWPGNSHRVIVVARPPNDTVTIDEETGDNGVE